jgi:2-dehydropantoate 2-reductase
MIKPESTVLVMGTGCVGAWLGGQLRATGRPVHMVGRPRLLDPMARSGLTLTDSRGGHTTVGARNLWLHTEVPADMAPGLVLLCVKARDTAEAAAELGRRLPSGTLVLSLQSGLRNVAQAQAAAPHLQVVPGVVPFQVTPLGAGTFHRSGPSRLVVQKHAGLRRWVPRLAVADIGMRLHSDLTALQWGQVLLRLNDAVNGLSGLPLREQWLDADFRHCTAALIDEALSVLARARIVPTSSGTWAPTRLPTLLRLPTPLFRLAAGRLLKLHSQSRSPLADDLERRRTTELDDLQGEVLRLAAQVGKMAMANTRISEMVRAWQHHRQPIHGKALRQALGL